MEEPDNAGGNTLGNLSLALGVVSTSLVFGIGLCAVVGAQQGWIRLAGTPLYICGASSAFLGLLAFGLGLAGVFGRRRSRATAIAGFMLGLAGMCLFVLLLNAVAVGA